RQPERLAAGRHQEEVGDGEDLLDGLLLAEEADLVVDAELAGERLADRPVRPVADQQQLDAAGLARSGVVLGPDALAKEGVEDAHHVGGALDLAEVGDVDEEVLALGADGPLEVVLVRAPETRGVHEVRDHRDLALDVEALVGLAAEVVRDGRDPVARVDGVLDDGAVRRVLPDERDVGAVQGGYDGDVAALAVEDLAGEDGAGGVGDGVVDVEEVEALVPHDVHHLARQRDGVGGVLEERVRVDAALVDEQAVRDVVEAEGEVVGDEVDLVAARGGRLAELGGDDAGAAVGGGAGVDEVHGGAGGRALRYGSRAARGSFGRANSAARARLRARRFPPSPARPPMRTALLALLLALAPAASAQLLPS